MGTLQKLRAVVPGTMILLGLIPVYTFYSGKAPDLSSLITGGVALVASFILGGIYNNYQCRALFNQSSHDRVNAHIKETLLAIGRTEPLSLKRRNELLQGRELMNVFYALVDTNPSLKERSKRVMYNGIYWTSYADATVLGIFFVLIYILLWLITQYKLFLAWAVICGAVAFVSGAFLHRRAEQRHLQLGREQLEFIDSELKAEVQQRVNRL